MKRIAKILFCLTLLLLGAATIGLTAVDLRAASLPLMTGPAGSNPAASPQNLGDYNSIIQAVNANAAFGGTGTPSQAIGVVSTTTGTIGASVSTYQLLQFPLRAFSNTATSTCQITGATRCLGVLDGNGKLVWIGVNG